MPDTRRVMRTDKEINCSMGRGRNGLSRACRVA